MLNHAAPTRATGMALTMTLTALLSAGCASLPPPVGSETAPPVATADGAEAIFLYQSRIASRVLDRYAYLEIDGEADVDPTLAAADARMAEICRHLNEAAVGKAEGQAPGWDLKLKVFATSGACAAAAREVELLLDNGGDSIATARL